MNGHAMRDWTDVETAWLAGLLEGEGSFMAGSPSKPTVPRIAIEMTDHDVLARVAEMHGLTVRAIKPRSERWKPTFTVVIGGYKAITTMERLRPYMGARRLAQMDRALASAEGMRKKKLTLSDAEEIRRRLAEGEPSISLVREFGISRSLLYSVRNGDVYKPYVAVASA